MIKKYILSLTFCLSIILATASDLSDKLTTLAEKHNFSYTEMKTDTFFSEKYALYFEQYIDHKHPEKGQFQQRVFLSHQGFEQPMVFITEGYAANYAQHPRYINELSSILQANQICVEHRYFGESVPKEKDWQYLTVYNSASDHHVVVEVMKQIYAGKWVNTGISKGGQTTMYHRYYYPDDVDVSVGYVCPLNFSVEDKRVYRFLENVGDTASRKQVKAYQTEMLKNKEKYLPAFEKLANEKNLSYKMGIEKAYELTVLEYSFAFWQWGNMKDTDIPLPAEEPDKMIEHLNAVAGINWISNQGIKSMQPFFYQALVEIGFYGYDISGFEEWVSYNSNPIFDFTAPENTLVVWNPEPMQGVDQFIRHKAENMIFIYGESDPWSSTAVDLTYNNNLIKVVKPGGSHLTRIGNLPADQQNLVIKTLKEWLNMAD